MRRPARLALAGAALAPLLLLTACVGQDEGDDLRRENGNAVDTGSSPSAAPAPE